MWSTIIDQITGVTQYFGRLKHTYCSVLWFVQLVHFTNLFIFFILLQCKQHSDPLQCDDSADQAHGETSATERCSSEGRLFFVDHVKLSDKDILR